MDTLRSCRLVVTLLAALAGTAASAAVSAAQQAPTPPAAATAPPSIRDPKAFAVDFFAQMAKNEAQAYDT